MLSLDDVRTILHDPELSDEEAEAIRDAYRTWAELLLEMLSPGLMHDRPVGNGFEQD